MINAKKLKLAQWEAPESQIFFQGHVDFGSVLLAITEAHLQKRWHPFRDITALITVCSGEDRIQVFPPGIKRKSSQKMKDVEISRHFAMKLRRCSSNLRGRDRNKQWNCCKFTKEADEMVKDESG